MTNTCFKMQIRETNVSVRVVNTDPPGLQQNIFEILLKIVKGNKVLWK